MDDDVVELAAWVAVIDNCETSKKTPMFFMIGSRSQSTSEGVYSANECGPHVLENAIEWGSL